MKENKENVEVLEEVVTEEEQVEETKKENVFKKGVNFVKRNGKKIGTGVLIGAGLVAAYAFGKKSGEDSEVCEDEDDDVEFTDDTEDSEVEAE